MAFHSYDLDFYLRDLRRMVVERAYGYGRPGSDDAEPAQLRKDLLAWIDVALNTDKQFERENAAFQVGLLAGRLGSGYGFYWWEAGRRTVTNGAKKGWSKDVRDWCFERYAEHRQTMSSAGAAEQTSEDYEAEHNCRGPKKGTILDWLKKRSQEPRRRSPKRQSVNRELP